MYLGGERTFLKQAMNLRMNGKEKNDNHILIQYISKKLFLEVII